MTSDLFTPLFVPAPVAEAVSGEAWVRAMLEVEAALAEACADEGLVPREAAAAIARFAPPDPSELGVAAREPGNPVVPLVRELRRSVPQAHFGATSQDVLDTAAMLVARSALDVILGELAAVAATCARLADEHRRTAMAGRTLLQQAVPTTFGLKAAVWLSAVGEAEARLRGIRLSAQLGGAAGTLASYGDRAPAVLAAFARRLGLAEPPLPWHAERGRMAELGAALAIAAGGLEKVALDVVLLAQTEVAEVAEGDGGRSSAMPHKRNPAKAVRARAAARSVRAAAGVLLEAMAGEQERAAGAWHSEWSALSDALAGTGGAAWAVRESLDALRVDAERMRANLEGLPSATGEEIARALAAADRLIDRALEAYAG